MKRIIFWFDVISPFAYLAFEHLPQALEGCSYEVQYRPVLFAGLLGHWGQKGPAEIAPKRAWTFRHIAWLSHTLGIAAETPATHPFNPLPLLRLGLACSDAGGTPNRHVVETLMRHVWRGGADAEDPARQAALAATLAPRVDPASDAIKQRLRDETDAALARGVFGVPTLGIGDKLFWGFDALDMAAALLRGDPWFDAPHWQREGAPRSGVKRS